MKLRRTAPLRAVGGQEQEEEKAELGVRATDHKQRKKTWCLGPGWIVGRPRRGSREGPGGKEPGTD